MDHTTTVAEWTVAHPGAISIFSKYRIDYCCGGQRSLADACLQLGLDVRQVCSELEHSRGAGYPLHIQPATWRSSFLVDYILENHHRYVRSAIPEISMLLEKVCERHGHALPELGYVRQAFSAIADELLGHMEKEELVLFPAMKNSESGSGMPTVRVPLIQGAIRAMEADHEMAGDLIRRLRSLTNDYTPPDYACPTFQATYSKLKDFDRDLMEHVHLENNILFPAFDATELTSEVRT